MSEHDLSEPKLDTPELFEAVDPQGMMARIDDFPQQIGDAWAIVGNFDVDRDLAQGIRQILVIGMGGSAIGGDLVAGLVAHECPVPVLVHRGYGLPAWVDEHTLVIASSYSGGTEETLSGWDAAGERDTRRAAITTGGTLAQRAREAGTPLLTFSYDAQPRAALGYSFTLLYGLLARLGLIHDPSDAIEGAVEMLAAAGTAWKLEVNVGENLAKQIAHWYAGALPVIFGAEHLSAVARRWTTQINENSKAWAVWAEMPELNHNVVVGLGQPRGTTMAYASEGERGPATGLDRSDGVADLVRVTNLRSAFYHERVSLRFDVTGELLDEAEVQWTDLMPTGGAGRLAEMLWTIWLGDYVSYYLAALYDTDPTPVAAIDRLKARLAEHG